MRCLFLCLHADGNSFLLLSDASCGCVIMKSFSAVHKLHLFVLGEKDFALLRIFQVML